MYQLSDQKYLRLDGDIALYQESEKSRLIHSATTRSHYLFIYIPQQSTLDWLLGPVMTIKKLWFDFKGKGKLKEWRHHSLRLLVGTIWGFMVKNPT